MNLAAQRYLEAIESRFAGAYRAAIEDLLLATATRDGHAADWARKRLERTVTEAMGVGEVLGALVVLQAAAGVKIDEGGAKLRAELRSFVAFRDTDPAYALPRVSLSEAVGDMVARVPVTLRDAAERTANAISRLYGEGRVIAFAKAAEQAVTERAQAVIIQAMREGMSENDAVARIRREVDRVRIETAPWTDAYTQTAFRTNVNTAVTAGRFRQAQDPTIRAVAPCFQFSAVGDSDTRDNHRAADGIILKVGNPEWNRIAPPLGFNCRCTVALVTTPMLRRMGRIDANGNIREDVVPNDAFPDPGFRHDGRPDLFIVSGTT